jgi:hypothetical protein
MEQQPAQYFFRRTAELEWILPFSLRDVDD